MKRSGLEKRLRLPIARREMIPIAKAPRTNTPTTAGLILVFMSVGCSRGLALGWPDAAACQKVYDLGIGRRGHHLGRLSLRYDPVCLAVQHDDAVRDPED